MKRRGFLNTMAMGYAGLQLPWARATLGANPPAAAVSPDKGTLLIQSLLQEWCDGMLRVQVDAPSDPATHGALSCPSCGFIHGRCMDAVYPFLHMAHRTGDEKYLKAGIDVFEWAKNVEQSDGSWTVIADPNSWRGISVFGAIALAETLHYHGELLDADRRRRWTERLRKVAEFIHRNFKLDYSNINYGATAVYGLNLLGRVLDEADYVTHSRELAGGIKNYLTEPNHLLFGEGHPMERNPKGLWPVDLGYNVEESLNGIALYTLHEEDPEFRALVIDTMRAHLEFMLPDGGWDNSWGTRHFKWTYWGSRTSDGCQPAYAMLANLDPAFGAAAYHNTLQMKACTRDGLLHGGPHYAHRGAPPCVHHTFTHAKALANVLDMGMPAGLIDDATPLPRATADGIAEFPEVATWLAARGPWRATVTAYSWIYRESVHHPMGGALSMLYHMKLGPVLAGSMTKYLLAEKNNMQANPEPIDYPLTPRIETRIGDQWFTNLFDVDPEVAHIDNGKTIEFAVKARLVSEEQSTPPGCDSAFNLTYRLDGRGVTIRAQRTAALPKGVAVSLAVPVISLSGEKVNRTSANQLTIERPGGVITVAGDVPLRIAETGRDRVFNLIPGFEALPIVLDLPAEHPGAVECRITVA
jgi:hypothetical protein